MSLLGKFLAVSASVIGSVALTFWLGADSRSPTLAAAVGPPAAPTPLDLTTKFRHTGAVHGLTPEGHDFSSETYMSADGVGLSLTRQHCRSAENANRALRLRLREATEILEETSLFNEQGEPTGDRVVALFNSPDAPKPTPLILWTDEATLYVLDSSSFPHSLLLEQRFFHQAP